MIPQPGDLILIHWKDFAGSEGDSEKAEAPFFTSCGFFREWKLDADNEWVLITERALHHGDYAKGWDSFPNGAIRNIEIIEWQK